MALRFLADHCVSNRGEGTTISWVSGRQPLPNPIVEESPVIQLQSVG